MSDTKFAKFISTKKLDARRIIAASYKLETLTPERARAIGEAALVRVMAEHTYRLRGAQVDALFQAHFARAMEVA